MCAFEDTPNKQTIRQQWDLPILKRWYSKFGALTYFGLPGPELYDLRDWRKMLAPQCTGVETLGRNKREQEAADDAAGRLAVNLQIHELSSGFELLRGDIEDIIINGQDAYSVRPIKSDGAPAHLARFAYDLVNLDFDGGLGYRSGKHHETKRIMAVERLIQRQRGHSFVFFITVSVRHDLGKEIETYLGGLQSRARGSDSADALDWYIRRGKGEVAYKLKVIVPTLVQTIAEMNMFECRVFAPISYKGYQRAKMVHFAFELQHRQVNLRAWSSQTEHDLIRIPFLQVEDGQLQIAAHQHPGLTEAECEAALEHLPSEQSSSIIATFLARTTDGAA